MRSLRCMTSRGLSFSAMDRRAARCGLYAPNWGCTAASPSAATVRERNLPKRTPRRTALCWRRGAKRLASPILRQWRRGVPVIATRCGGPEDFVTEENGILIPRGRRERSRRRHGAHDAPPRRLRQRGDLRRHPPEIRPRDHRRAAYRAL